MLTLQERHHNISARGQGRAGGEKTRRRRRRGRTTTTTGQVETNESPLALPQALASRAEPGRVRQELHTHTTEHYDRMTICAIPTMAPRTPPRRMRIHSSSLKIGCNKFSNLSGGILCKASLFLASMSVDWPM